MYIHVRWHRRLRVLCTSRGSQYVVLVQLAIDNGVCFSMSSDLTCFYHVFWELAMLQLS